MGIGFEDKWPGVNKAFLKRFVENGEAAPVHPAEMDVEKSARRAIIQGGSWGRAERAKRNVSF